MRPRNPRDSGDFVSLLYTLIGVGTTARGDNPYVRTPGGRAMVSMPAPGVRSTCLGESEGLPLEDSLLKFMVAGASSISPAHHPLPAARPLAGRAQAGTEPRQLDAASDPACRRACPRRGALQHNDGRCRAEPGSLLRSPGPAGCAWRGPPAGPTSSRSLGGSTEVCTRRRATAAPAIPRDPSGAKLRKEVAATAPGRGVW